MGDIPNTPPFSHRSLQQPDRLVKIAELSGDAGLPDPADTVPNRWFPCRQGLGDLFCPFAVSLLELEENRQ